jgi:hypothetical protein
VLNAAHEEMEIAVHEWLPMQESNFYHDGIFKLMQMHQCVQGLR